MYREPYWYNSGITPDVGTGVIEISRCSGGLKTGLIVYGVGNHGGGATRRDVERIIEMQEWRYLHVRAFRVFGSYARTGELNAISKRLRQCATILRCARAAEPRRDVERIIEMRR